MAPSNPKKRKNNATRTTKASKKIRTQDRYSSSSSSSSAAEDDFLAVNLADSDSDSSPDPCTATATSPKRSPTPERKYQSTLPSVTALEPTSDSDSTNPPTTTPRTKRTDPTAFASSISAILASKLTAPKRADPVLARSAAAATASTELANTRLEKKARRKIREERKAGLERGRVRDVLLGDDGGGGGGGGLKGDGEGKGAVGVALEEERRLRKTAQRGVVKLFNAVRQAQVKGEKARRDGVAAGVELGGSRGRREERVGEMTRKGFLEMVGGGGGVRDGEAGG